MIILPQWNADVDWPLASQEVYTARRHAQEHTRRWELGNWDRRRVAVWRRRELRLLQCCSMLLIVPAVPWHGRPFRCDQEQILYSLTISSFRVSRLICSQQFIIQGERGRARFESTYDGKKKTAWYPAGIGKIGLESKSENLSPKATHIFFLKRPALMLIERNFKSCTEKRGYSQRGKGNKKRAQTKAASYLNCSLDCDVYLFNC